MCRNIRTLANYEPPATQAEIRDAALQFVRKLAGPRQPSKRNDAAFSRAVEAIATAAGELIGSLESNQKPRNREAEAARARERSAQRFGPRA